MSRSFTSQVLRRAFWAPVLLAVAVQAGPSNDSIVSRLSGVERVQLDNLQALDARVLQDVAERADPERLERRTRELLALDVPAIGARRVLESGRSPIHEYILGVAEGLGSSGLETVGSFRGEVAAPVSLDRLRDPEMREAAAHLRVDGERIAVHPLWPNGPMPSLAPLEGITGQLVYCGGGEWSELDGRKLEGAIALLDFRGATNLERLFSLGVAAVVVLEDGFVQYENASFLFSITPSPFPRFFAGGESRQRLLELALRSEPVTAQLHGGQIYENRPVESLFFRLPAADQISITVTGGQLLEWVAAHNNVSVSELVAANEGATAFRPGDRIRVPGGRDDFLVPADGLWSILSSLYGLDPAALKAANPEQAGAPLEAGATVAIPGSHTPLLVLVPIDTTSVVPDLPHGARAMANVAAALELMEHLSTNPRLRLRRDVIFGFIDGDTLGGQGSRLVAEYTYLLDGDLSRGATREEGQALVLERYQAGARWFEDGQAPENGLLRQWLVDEWLRPRFEEVRIGIAERRIDRIVGTRASAALPPLEELERQLLRVAELRDATVAALGGDRDRLNRLFAAWQGPEADDLAAFGLDRETLRARFLDELAEEQEATSNHQHNLEAARRLREAVRGAEGARSPLALAWRLDLGDGAPHLGIVNGPKMIRKGLVGIQMIGSLGSRMRKIAAYGATRAGWAEDHTFIALEDRVNVPVVDTRLTVTYDDFWNGVDVRVLPLGSASDRHERVDTPADTLSSIDWKNFSLQTRTAFTLIGAGLESILDTRVQQTRREIEISRVAGRAVQFNIRSGIDARDPVPGTYVFLPMVPADSGFVQRNTDIFHGYRRGIVSRTRLNGSFTMPVAIAGMNLKPRIYAYKLDRERAVFTKVATQGQVGTKPQKNEFKYRPGETVDKNLVLIDVYPRVIFIGLNPSSLKPILGTGYDQRKVDLVDAVIEGAPRDFAVDNPVVDFRESQREAVTLYLPEGDQVRASVRFGLDYEFLLTGPLELDAKGKARGKGILIGPDPESGDRNITLPLTGLQVARGMWTVANNRLGLYREYGIFARDLQDAVDRAGELVAEAEEAAAAGHWQLAIGSAREAWGILVKNFPRVLQLGREAVFSVILLMALAVPGAWFLERLVVGSKGIVARLTGVTVIFILATLFLNYFHPAFRIALSPFIIVIAFTMILMSVVVLALSYGRFDVVLRRYRSAGGEVQSEEISFMSSLSTAFSLGVSNLKKRAFRTGLTAFTVTVLTFSIVGFVAVKGRDALTRNALPLDATVEGRPVEALPPAYNGILIRSHNWRDAGEGKVSAVEAEFGGRYPVTVRGHYMEEEGGNSANREGVNQIPVRWRGAEYVVNAISVLQPNETLFTGIDQAVSHRTWFRAGHPDTGEEPDRFAIILPDVVAERLGITPEMLVDAEGQRLPDAELPEVEMRSLRWRVIGILDTDLANRIRDVNGRSLAVVDYLRSGMSTNTSPGDLITESNSFHMDWKRLAIVPYAARYDVDAKPRSIAVRIPEGVDPEHVFEDMALRLKTEFFAAVDGEVTMVVPRKKIDMAGLAKIFLPVLLCVLIVMNTMLGTVEERKGEVGMLGAIGLSPRQIAFLMFAESTVFSVLGIVLGTFGGLLFSNIVNAINAGGGHFLTSLSFNFTSMISMLLATGTGLVVLLATLVPARKAAALAAPSGMAEWVLPEDQAAGEINFHMPFTLTRGNAVGMAAFFNQFLVNHSDATSDDFNCREVSIRSGVAEGRPFIEMSTDMWLAPYDLDVAQHFTLRMQAGARESVFEVDLRLVRFSGSEENSRRTAYNLLNLVRRQFLLWRNLDPDRRTQFIEQGARLLQQR